VIVILSPLLQVYHWLESCQVRLSESKNAPLGCGAKEHYGVEALEQAMLLCRSITLTQVLPPNFVCHKIWWSWRELNPRPQIEKCKPLHA